MELRQRVQRRQWSLRCGQSLLAAAAGALAFGLTAAAEGLPVVPLAVCGALLLATLVLVVARPWQGAIEALDPTTDEDGLLRTTLSRGLTEQQLQSLQDRARTRQLRLRPLPDWQAWGLCLGLACAGSGWVLLAPPPVEQPVGFALSPSLHQDGSLVAAPEAATETAPGAESDRDGSAEMLSPPTQDGGTGTDTEQWVPVAAQDDASAVGFGLDLGLDQQVYERYLRNRSKRP